MAVTQYVPVAQVRRRDDARVLDQGAVKIIADSMREVGQITPILIRAAGDGYELIAGSHRLAAAVSLSWADILAIHAEHDDDLHAELAMIDENLCRSELSATESAAQMARRKVIYEALHPEARHGGARASRKVCDLKSDNANNAVERFSANTAAATGRSERSVQLDTERGEKIHADAMALVRGTKLDTGAYLDKLKRLPPKEQVETAKRDLKAIMPGARRDKAKQAAKASKSPAHTHKDAPAGKASGPSAHEQLIAALDTLDAIDARQIVATCPPRQRAALCQRASSAIELLGTVMEEASA